MYLKCKQITHCGKKSTIIISAHHGLAVNDPSLTILKKGNDGHKIILGVWFRISTNLHSPTSFRNLGTFLNKCYLEI